MWSYILFYLEDLMLRTIIVGIETGKLSVVYIASNTSFFSVLSLNKAEIF